MHGHVLYNSDVLPADSKILQAGQIGVLSGWGVFTTMRIAEGIPFAFERHWERMARDARTLHIDLSQDPDAVRRNLLRLVEANGADEATMRVCVFRSEGGFWAGPGSGNASDLVAMTNDVMHWAESVTLDAAEQGRHAASPFAGTKTLSWAHNLTLVETARQNGDDEVILLNERNEVAECTSANIFAAKGGTTYTPPLSSGPLPGVTRALMLDELDAAGAPVEEKVLSLDDFYEADEVFITSTTRELLPVSGIRGRRLRGGDGPWPVMETLRTALAAYMRRYVQEAKRRVA